MRSIGRQARTRVTYIHIHTYICTHQQRRHLAAPDVPSRRQRGEDVIPITGIAVYMLCMCTSINVWCL